MNLYQEVFFILVIIQAKCVLSSDEHVNHQYCIVGAGPSGLQMGYFLERSNRDYMIFEQNNVSGSFYVKYPRHRKLISINKRHTGQTNKEFNFRHDWNSLISDDESLQMRYYSKDFFPQADIFVKYLNDYATKLQLNIQYNTRIRNIRKKTISEGLDVFLMDDQNGKTYSCQVMIMGTGIGTPNKPYFAGMEHTDSYEDMSINTDDFEGKSVMILGRGNSAFETADHIVASTNVIHMMARSRIKLAWETHYVGDLRAVNNGLLDTYQLKSLDGVLEASMAEVVVMKNEENGKLGIVRKEQLGVEIDSNYTTVNHTVFHKLIEQIDDNYSLRQEYDYVIRCLGFLYDFNVFNSTFSPEPTANGKYPTINAAYEVKNVADMFVIGTSSHSLDFKKSAGGFIHGFRYSARALHHLLEYRYHNIPWPSTFHPISELINNIIKRANEASGIYQMFTQLGDVIILHENGLYDYLEEFPLQLLHKLPEVSGRNASKVIVLSMEYGKDYSGPGKDVFKPERSTGDPANAHQSNFLHPVLYYYQSLPTEFEMITRTEKQVLPTPHRIHHMVEDFLTDFSAPQSHILPLRRFLENCMGQDIRYFFDDFCFKSALMYTEVPLMCKQYYMKGQGLPGTKSLMLRKKLLCGDEMRC
ncbi:FAD-dependent oxidoreductase domain-containing protein 2-like [Antedon mediterranea]|uniref:FAD-dependent oxidoreductase domain-containing protein 2-like n=1 Tax=Antedon mediterranea TaxID=105859 RepID=UPI003AF6B580